MDHRNRAKLIDVPERRALAQPLELRDAKDGTGNLVLEGYASTWDEYDCYGGPQAGGWVEQIDRGGMKRTLTENPDVMLLVNHEGLPLARTKSGTLALKEDKHGLFMRAMLDPEDPDVRQIAPKLKRHDLDEMSFAFRVKDQVWNNNYDHRLITELSLQKGDVSVVNYGMNPNTHVEIMDTIGQLAQLSNKELLEVRGRVDPRVLQAAQQNLLRAVGAGDQRSAFAGGGAFVNFDGSHLLYEGNCVTCAGARSRGTTGNVPYADPGFIDGVQRLPVDELHVKASWQYFNQPKNQSGYTRDQLAQIRGSIQTAMTMHGHDVDEEKGMADVEISHIESVRAFGGGVSLVAVMTDGSRTPLPSFRQSGELVGAGAGGGGNPFGARGAGDDKDPENPGPDDDVADRGKMPPQFMKGKGKDDGDAEDDPAKGGDGGKDDATEGPDGKKKPAAKDEKKSDDDMQMDGLRDNGHGMDCNCPMCKMDDELRAGDGNDEEPDDDPDDMPPDTRSASQRLAELRKTAELPDRPSVEQALGYLRQLA